MANNWWQVYIQLHPLQVTVQCRCLCALFRALPGCYINPGRSHAVIPLFKNWKWLAGLSLILLYYHPAFNPSAPTASITRVQLKATALTSIHYCSALWLMKWMSPLAALSIRTQTPQPVHKPCPHCLQCHPPAPQLLSIPLSAGGCRNKSSRKHRHVYAYKVKGRICNGIRGRHNFWNYIYLIHNVCIHGLEVTL